ncbi:MAG: DUF1569 domain-containing protein [Saprospiraceae bacterium]
MKKPLILKNLGEVMDWLDRMEKAENIQVQGPWDVYQNLYHCALALGFTIKGYPEPKSRLFQATIGKLAYHVYSSRGYMRHDTAQPTEGTQAAPPNGSLEGIHLLRESILTFDQWEGPLQPHVAYGHLNKKQYEKAHTMHIANHLENFIIH